MTTQTTPTQPQVHRRVHDLDALRGFALLGIFVVNITFMASAYPGNLVIDPNFASPVDDAARFTVTALFSMKFYLLFSFLFGYSFVLQIDAAERAGKAFVPRMLRRILGLFLIGAAHIVVFGAGDILTTYAVVALILLAMYRVRDIVALRTAIGIYLFVLASFISSGLFMDQSAFMPDSSEALATAQAQTQDMLGSVTDIVQHNFSGLDILILQAVSMQGPMALAMFLLGMVAARRQIFSNVDGSHPWLRRIQLVGFPIGLAGAVIYAGFGGPENIWGTMASVATAPLLTAAYIATLIRAMHSRPFAWLRDALAPAGRIALTNYLAQTVAGFLLFTGIGFGLAGSVSPLMLIGVAFAVFSLQVVVSAWWLRQHRYGPAEYMLRGFTNWSRR